MFILKTLREQIYNYCGNWFPHSFHNLSFLTDFNQFKPRLENLDNTGKKKMYQGFTKI